MNEEQQIEIRYSSYTPAQKKATQKYRQQNKDKVNEQRKKYYQTRKEKDPEFLEYKRAKAREYYLKQKEARASRRKIEPQFFDGIPEPLPPVPEPIIEPVAELVPEPDTVVVVAEPVLEAVKVKKVRAKRTKKTIHTEEQKNII
jgi:hypothetical protein